MIAPWNNPETEWRCEAHPDRTWEQGEATDCHCGAPGVPYLHGEPYPTPPRHGSSELSPQDIARPGW